VFARRDFRPRRLRGRAYTHTHIYTRLRTTSCAVHDLIRRQRRANGFLLLLLFCVYGFCGFRLRPETYITRMMYTEST